MLRFPHHLHGSHLPTGPIPIRGNYLCRRRFPIPATQDARVDPGCERCSIGTAYVGLSSSVYRGAIRFW